MAQTPIVVPGAVKTTGGGTHVPGTADPELYQLNLKPDELSDYHAIFAKLNDEGMGDGLPLHVMTVLTMEMNRLRPLAQGDAAKAKQFKEVTDQLSRLTSEAQKRRDAKNAGESVPKMVSRYMAEARHHIEDNIGEFTFMCKSCGEVVTTDGLPLWAVQFVKDDDGEIITYKWSPEVMKHYNDGLIPLHVAAHILRTSPKSLYHTADKWKEPLKPCNIDEEERLLRELLLADASAWERKREDELVAEETEQ